MQKINLLHVRLTLFSNIYKILGSFSCEATEIEGIRSQNEMSSQAIPAWRTTDKFYGLGSRNKHHSVSVCIVRPLSAMICISSRDPLNCSASCLQLLGRSCILFQSCSSVANKEWGGHNSSLIRVIQQKGDCRLCRAAGRSVMYVTHIKCPSVVSD